MKKAYGCIRWGSRDREALEARQRVMEVEIAVRVQVEIAGKKKKKKAHDVMLASAWRHTGWLTPLSILGWPGDQLRLGVGQNAGLEWFHWVPGWFFGWVLAFPTPGGTALRKPKHQYQLPSLTLNRIITQSPLSLSYDCIYVQCTTRTSCL
ncbi:uncharacterized protein LOC125477819 [Pyrus x bretschneideri]|uniref:uncharacterized protein LOC125477819 n=1 Tax=Pyrus x bretschneideri TaxID=225117 RepID=UPI002030418E|nr:uncharacterized protein LOC125477819 [Pyrus x bretschneideri]